MKAILSKEAGGYDLYRIDEDGKRVTFASTQDYKQKLSLKNCQAIERGYDLDELAEGFIEKTGYDDFDSYSYKLGFQKALELMKHRLPEETEWDVEVETEEISHYKGSRLIDEYRVNKLNSEGCLILKRV